MFERFTDQARSVVIGAQQQARDLGHDTIRPEHLLLALLDGGASIGAPLLVHAGADRAGVLGDLGGHRARDDEALQAFGIDVPTVRRRVEATFGAGALDGPPRRRTGWLRRLGWTSTHIPFSAAAKRALEQSLRETLELGQRALTGDHLLLGLLATEHDPVPLVLTRLGVDPAALRRELRSRLAVAA